MNEVNKNCSGNKNACRLKLEELQRMLNLYSDIFYHIKTELLWEEGEIDLKYWVSALKEPVKVEEYDEELKEIKEHMNIVMNEILQVGGFLWDGQDGTYKRAETVMED